MIPYLSSASYHYSKKQGTSSPVSSFLLPRSRCCFCLHTPVYPGICKHNSPFTIRNRVGVIPFSINQLPACLHTGVDVYVEISAQSRGKNQPALSISVSTKYMPCPIVQFPCKTFIGTANTAETHQNAVEQFYATPWFFCVTI